MIKNSIFYKKGFSLMELLVVISIIAILVTMGVVSYSTAQKKGRDARRQGDMKAIQTAFEQYYAMNNSSYPATCPASGGSITITTGQTFTIPTDPKNSTPYTYTTGTCDSSSYCYCAAIEGGGGNSAAACAQGTGFYCVSERQ